MSHRKGGDVSAMTSEGVSGAGPLRGGQQRDFGPG